MSGPLSSFVIGPVSCRSVKWKEEVLVVLEDQGKTYPGCVPYPVVIPATPVETEILRSVAAAGTGSAAHAMALVW